MLKERERGRKCVFNVGVREISVGQLEFAERWFMHF